MELDPATSELADMHLWMMVQGHEGLLIGQADPCSQRRPV